MQAGGRIEPPGRREAGELKDDHLHDEIDQCTLPQAACQRMPCPANRCMIVKGRAILAGIESPYPDNLPSAFNNKILRYRRNNRFLWS